MYVFKINNNNNNNKNQAKGDRDLKCGLKGLPGSLLIDL